jgi:hypothetical protein
MDAMYAQAVLATALEYLQSGDALFSTIGGTWMTDADVVERPYSNGGGDDDDVRIQ